MIRLLRAFGLLVAGLMLAHPVLSQGTWTSKAQMTTPRSGPAVGAVNGLGAAVINGILYAVGGWNGSIGVATVEAYNPSTNTWSTKAPMPAARSFVAATAVGGKLYVIGGDYTTPPSNTVTAYDPVANSWTSMASMPTARGHLGVDVLDGVVYAIGGVSSGTVLSAAEAFTPIVTIQASLSIALGGLGAGGVTSSPAGINCPAGPCSSSFAAGTVVTLTATPAAGSAFTGWTGAGCGGTGNCVITLGAGATVTAAFGLAPGSGVLSAAPSGLDFGAQSRNTTSPAKTLTLSNTGASSLSVTGITTAGPFAVSGSCATIAAGANCPLSVTFTPASDGAIAGGIAIGSSGGSASITLTGVGERSLVVHYYRSILRRDPDAGGKAFWESEAVRLAAAGGNVNEAWYAMAMSFFFSAEYAAFNRDNTGFVTDLYNAFYNRGPDPGGLAFWKGQLDQGMPREVLLASFMFSPEFAGFTQAIFGNAAVRREIDAVFDFYRGLLSRLPDNGGLSYWVAQFRSAQCGGGSGQVYTQADGISAAFIGSPEYAARARSNSQFVGDLYNAFLRRGGDLAGVSFWIAELSSGRRTRDQVRQAFLASAEFNGRVGAVVAEGCQPTITSVASSLAPLTAAQIGFVGLNSSLPITVQFTGAGGFTSTADALLTTGSGLLSAGVPIFPDPTTKAASTGTASLVLKQGNLATAAVQVTLLPLPRSSDYGLVLGEASRAFLRFQIVMVGQRINQLQAARLLLGSNTTAAEAALLDRLKFTLKAKDEVDKVFANNALVINGGTTSAGQVVRFDRDVLEAMDRVYLVYIAKLVQNASSAGAKAAAKAFYDPIMKASDIAGLVKANQDAVGSDDPVVFTRAAVGGIQQLMEYTAAGAPSKVFAERLGASMSLFNIGYAGTDVLLDGFSLYLHYGGDPVAIQQDLDNLARHRVDLLSASLNAATFGLLNVVPANTPGALNVAGFALTSDLVDLIASGVENAMQLTTTGVANQLRNPFPPRQGFGVITGPTKNMPPQGSLGLCCIAGAEIIGMPDAGGSYSIVVPLGVPNTNYGSMTLSIREIITGTSRASANVNLGNLPTLREIQLPLFTVQRDCYAEYETCSAPCVPAMGAFAFAQCVNACLAAWNACLSSP